MDIKAAPYSVSVDKSSVAPGGTFNVTISGNVRGKFYLSGSNATVQGSIFMGGYVTFTCTAGTAGTAVINLTPASGDDAGAVYTMDDVAVTEGASVSVSVVAPNSGSSGSTGGGSSSGGNSENTGINKENTPEENKTMDLSLKSLTVSEGTLSPQFSSEVLEYSLPVGKKTKKIDVAATPTLDTVIVEGTGSIDITADDQEIIITCKSPENGDTRTYKIKIEREEVPTLYLKGPNGERLGVLTLRKAPKLEGFEDITLKISGKDVQVRKNKSSNISLIYLMDTKNKANYYIYDEKKKKVTSIYIPIQLLGSDYAIITVPEKMKKMSGFIFKKLKIDNQELEGWKFENLEFKNYSLLYLMDSKGESKLYQHERIENKLQIFSDAAPITFDDYEQLLESNEKKKILIFVLGGVGILLISASTFLLMSTKKRTRRK